MKKLYVLFVILLTCLANQSFATLPAKISLRTVLSAANKEMIAGRIRVQPEEIVVEQQGVFLNLSGQCLAVESLASDANGLYCFFGEGDDEDDSLWECSYCHTLNNSPYAKMS